MTQFPQCRSADSFASENFFSDAATVRALIISHQKSVISDDLRASAARVIVGLAAKGSTQVNRIYHLDCGFEQMDVKLKKLGARIQRVEEK